VRVIAGEARGVPLAAPPGREARPTADRTKEAIFDVLGDLGCDGRVLDLFAGSGGLGIEALSRGATWCDFVESSPAACRVLEANLTRTKLSGQGRVFRQSVERFLAAGGAGPAGPGREPYDLILLDPPYAMEGLDGLLRDLGASPFVGRGTALLVEHARRRPLPETVGVLERVKTRVHGDSAFSLYLAAGPAGGAEPGAGGGPG
jgi:16S rRNA (guanine966-N2)-methyltransferase